MSPSSPRLSVLVPVWNGQRFLRQALESAVREIAPGDEILVSNDASVDGSRGILEEFEDRVTVLDQPSRLGLTRNHNLLLRAAAGEYVTFLHQDDEVTEGSFRARRATLAAHPALGLVSGDSLFVGPDGVALGPPQTPSLPRPSEIGSDSPEANDELRCRALAEAVQRNPFQVGSVMLRRSHTDQVGEFWEPLHLAVDYDYWLRSLLYAPLAHLPTPVLRFRVHKGQDSQQYREYPNLAQWEIYRAMAHARDESRRMETPIPPWIRAKWDSIAMVRRAASRLPPSWIRAAPAPIARTWGDLFGM